MREIAPRGRRCSAIVLAGLVAFVAVAVLGTTSPPALAKGVTFDPDSPAGQEYALPLAQARNETTGEDVSDDSPATSAPLFGAGIPPRDPQVEASPPGRDRAEPRAGGQAEGGRPRGGADSGGPVLLEADDGYPLMTSIGLVAGILLVGCALGLGLRGLQRPRST